MDESASDVANGIIALSDVAAEAGVNKLTGLVWKIKNIIFHNLLVLTAFLLCRRPRCGGWTDPE